MTPTMPAAEFYTRLEGQDATLGLTLIKREPIVRGDPTQGWRWLYRTRGGDEFWCSFNATPAMCTEKTLASERERMKAELRTRR